MDVLMAVVDYVATAVDGLDRWLPYFVYGCVCVVLAASAEVAVREFLRARRKPTEEEGWSTDAPPRR